MTTRRLFLGALPVAALTLSACSTNRTAKEVIDSVGPPPRPATPDDAIQALVDGNARFATNSPQVRNTADIELLWTSGIDQKQEPFASVLGCADSRLAPEIIFDQFVGDIFVVREAGNIAVSPTNLGSLEYGQAVLKSKVLVVLGHSDCGAVKAAYTKAEPGGNIQSVVDAIKPAIAGATSLEDAIMRNVRAVKDQIRRDSVTLREAEQSDEFAIVGAYYDITTAEVRFL
jgi:carbonic anhydrase